MPAKPKPIKAYNEELDLILYYKKAKDAGTHLGCDASVISKVCKGRLESSWGWTFKYIEDVEGIEFVSDEDLKKELQYEKKKTPWNKGKKSTKKANKPRKTVKAKKYKECEVCNLRFEKKRNTQKVCSIKCRNNILTKKGSEALKVKYTKERRSEASKKMWKENGDAIRESRRSIEYRSKIGNSVREAFKNSETKEKHRRACVASKTPEVRKKMSEAALDRISKGQRVTRPASIIMDLLKSMDINYKAEKVIKSDKYGGKVYDIYLPDYKILIEIMGDYHHCNPLIYKNPSEYQKRNMENDVIKNKLIKEEHPDHSLIYIWESDAQTSLAKCKRIILAAIEKESKNFYEEPKLSKYEIREIDDRDVVYKFLYKYHYLKSKALFMKKTYGLYLNDSLVGVSVFGPSSSKGAQNVIKGFSLELIRFCLVNNLPDNTASWFLSRSIKNIKSDFPDLKGLISFADTSLHLGTIYKATNWKSLGESKGSYYYLNSEGDRISRHTVYRHCTKVKMKERDYVEKLELKKIEGTQKEKFIYTFK